jgi:hypothetical protein
MPFQSFRASARIKRFTMALASCSVPNSHINSRPFSALPCRALTVHRGSRRSRMSRRRCCPQAPFHHLPTRSIPPE